MYLDFRYYCPTSIAELLDLMSEPGEYLIYSGGTDLLVQLRAKELSAKYLIDIKQIPELNVISETDTHITIGAAVCFTEIAGNEQVAKWASALQEAALTVGSVQIRNKATLGGNIQTASPAGDGLVAALGLDGEVSLLSATGQRRLPLAEFIVGPRETALKPGEVMTEIRIPKHDWCCQRFFKVGRRNALAISVVNGLVALKTNAEGIVEEARVALGAVAPTPVRICEAERVLIGQMPDMERIKQVKEIVKDCIHPISDIRASAAYRRYIAGVMVGCQINTFREGCIV